MNIDKAKQIIPTMSIEEKWKTIQVVNIIYHITAQFLKNKITPEKYIEILQDFDNSLNS